MAIIIKSLGRGTVQETQGPICGPPGDGKAAILKSMRFVNTGDESATLNVWFKRGNDAYHILPKDLSIGPGQLAVDSDEITLESTDSIEAVVGTGDTVEYVLSGIERDV